MINNERLIANFLELTVIEGVSRNEAGVMKFITTKLDKLGIGYEFDDAGSKVDGNIGNLIARIPATAEGTPFFFAAHVDTILSSAGSPEVVNGVIHCKDSDVLGADDRAGAAVMLEIAESVIEKKTAHPEIELLFLICEEIGLFGSRYLDYTKVDGKRGFVIDSSADFGKVVAHAPEHHSVKITIKGKPSHAAIAPEIGIHAVKIAAEAIHNTEVGRVNDDATVSIGIISGGTKTNIVPEKVIIEGEIRTLDQTLIAGLKNGLERNFKDAAVKAGGKVSFEWDEEYCGFKVSPDSVETDIVKKSYGAIGITPEFVKFVGGSDANNFNARGIPTFNLGQGYKKNHSSDEYIKVDDVINIARVCYEITKVTVGQ